jgi:hypothetical protein
VEKFQVPLTKFHQSGINTPYCLFIAEVTMLAFVTLLGGICALVLESNEHAKEVNATRGPILAVEGYPAIAVGGIVRGECKVSLVLADGTRTPPLVIARQAHAFGAQIGETMATLWIDDMTFTVPRANTH